MAEPAQWIEVIVALLLLIFSVVVFSWVLKFLSLPFNKLWKTRAMFVGATFVWVLSLLLGRDQIWNWDSSGGFFSISESGYQKVCQVSMLFTFGISQPIWFITLLFMIRTKTNASINYDLYGKNQNRVVIGWSLIWAIPMILFHIIIVAVSYVPSLYDPSNIWIRSFRSDEKRCTPPLASTTAFTCFYTIFLVFYIYYSRKFSVTLINKRLRHRIWLSQLFFSLFFPFEVLLRFIITVVSSIKDPLAVTVISHIFFFLDLIICIVGLLEFALFPVLDAAEFPMLEAKEALLAKSEPIQLESVSVHVKVQLGSSGLKNSSSANSNSSGGTNLSSSSNSNLTKNVTKSPSNYNNAMPSYTPGSMNEQQSVDEFRKQMARYSSNV